MASYSELSVQKLLPRSFAQRFNRAQWFDALNRWKMQEARHSLHYRPKLFNVFKFYYTKKARNSKEHLDYEAFADNLTSVHFPQDYMLQCGAHNVENDYNQRKLGF